MNSAYWGMPCLLVMFVIDISQTPQSSWSTRKPTQRRNLSSVQSAVRPSTSHQSWPFIKKFILAKMVMPALTVANLAKRWHCWSITGAHTLERGLMFARNVERGSPCPRLCRNIWCYTRRRELKERGEKPQLKHNREKMMVRKKAIGTSGKVLLNRNAMTWNELKASP